MTCFAVALSFWMEFKNQPAAELLASEVAELAHYAPPLPFNKRRKTARDFIRAR
jgi:hypothetical protein